MDESSDAHIDYERTYPHPHGETYTERMHRASRRVIAGIWLVIAVYVIVYLCGLIPRPADTEHHSEHSAAEQTAEATGHSGATELQSPGHPAEADVPGAEPYVPHLIWVAPFAILLLCIALLPLLHRTKHWWHHNRNRFLISAVLGIVTLAYYGMIHEGGIANHFTHVHDTAPGWPTLFAAFSNAIFAEYVPFIVLLFSLYVISGGINLRGDLPATPLTNSVFIGIGTLLASFIGTTGAAMVLIRPVLMTNAERKHKVHTMIFFIFMICNCGGLLLPIGDPPLFLGYLKGVPFLWTLELWPYWLAVNIMLMIIYYVWDSRAYRREELRDLVRDELEIRPLQISGTLNFLFLLGVVLCVGMIVPDQMLRGTKFMVPQFFRECVMLFLVSLSLMFTHANTRVLNKFDYVAIVEVAALFCGIFICMQVPVEILNIKGPQLGIDSSIKFFWATGVLSSFLDNAPTYVVFFETAKTFPAVGDAAVLTLAEGGHVLEKFLVPISLGAVFMGANTYIGNGPNFMVKSIAEQSGIVMPSFFGYMLYSAAILIPIFLAVTLVL